VLTINDIVYCPETHTSAAPDQRPVPHVTAILRQTGLGPDFSKVTGPALEYAKLIGSAVHEATALLDIGRLDWESVDDRIRGRVEAWRDYVKRAGLIFRAVELRVFSPTGWYVGMVDRVYQKPKAVGWHIGDLKTGTAVGAGIQMAAYARAYLETHRDIPVVGRTTWLVKDDGVTAIEHTDSEDFLVWAAARKLRWARFERAGKDRQTDE